MSAALARALLRRPAGGWPAAAHPVSLRKLHGAFAAEVSGVALTPNQPASNFEMLRQAWQKHLLLVFRAPAGTSAAAAAAFVARLASAGSANLLTPCWCGGEEGMEGAPDPRWLRWRSEGVGAATPPRLVALRAEEVPDGAAPMLFASQVAAHARLDPWLQDRIEFLEAEHGARPVIHPLVRLDPATGACALFLGEAGAVGTRLRGLGELEGRALLRRLERAATDPAVIYRHDWRSGDLVIWDNHAVLHRMGTAASSDPWRMPRLSRLALRPERPSGPAEQLLPWVSAG